MLKIEGRPVYFAPFLPAIILFGPNGQNLDVMAHELVHAELAHRSSALLRIYKIPSWFDEASQCRWKIERHMLKLLLLNAKITSNSKVLNLQTSTV